MNESPAYKLHKLVFILDRAADKMLQVKFGISHKRALFLIVLERQGAMPQHDLAVALGYSDPAVSIMLIELVKKGYVTIAPSVMHKRKRIVTLTDEGKALIKTARQYLDTHFAKLMESADVDIAHYGDLTERIYQALLTQKKNTYE